VKLDILLAGEEVDALSFIVHKDKAYDLARGLCDKLRDIIPRQQFEVPIQGAIGNKIISPLDREGAPQGCARKMLRR